MAKNIVSNVSVLTETNKIVAHSSADWSKIRPNSYIIVGNNYSLYEIHKTVQSIYNANFRIQTPKSIIVDKNVRPYLMETDDINLYYEEYELMTLLGVVNGGAGYKEGDILYLNGGDASLETSDNEEQKTSFFIIAVDELGGIKQLGLKNKGRYINPPESECSTYSSNGNDAVLNVQFIKTRNKTNIERNIFRIENVGDQSIIYLNYSLPSGLDQGIISVQKWEAHLTANFLGSNLFNVKAELINDFTQYLNLLMLLPNSLVKESIINRNFLRIEQELKRVNDRLDRIEKTLSITG